MHTKRESKFELLRIFSMLLIIAGHLFVQSGFYVTATGWNLYLGAILGQALIIGVNAFLILGVWFMVDAKFSSQRIVKLYLHLISYTWPITLLVFLLGFHPSIKDIARGTFPLVGKGLWFVSVYLVLLSLSPFLQKVLQWPRRMTKNLLILLSAFIPLWVTLWSFDRVENQWLDCVVWFAYVFLLIGYLKKYHRDYNPWNKYLVIVLAGGAYVVLSLLNIHYGGLEEQKHGLGKITFAFLFDMKSVPCFLMALAVFYFFKNLTIGYCKKINLLAKSALSVYVVHQTPAFIHVLWYDIFRVETWIGSPYSICFFIGTTISVYLVISLVDAVHRKYIEPRLLDCKMAQCLKNKLENFYAVLK